MCWLLSLLPPHIPALCRCSFCLSFFFVFFVSMHQFCTTLMTEVRHSHPTQLWVGSFVFSFSWQQSVWQLTDWCYLRRSIDVLLSPCCSFIVRDLKRYKGMSPQAVFFAGGNRVSRKKVARWATGEEVKMFVAAKRYEWLSYLSVEWPWEHMVDGVSRLICAEPEKYRREIRWVTEFSRFRGTQDVALQEAQMYVKAVNGTIRTSVILTGPDQWAWVSSQHWR